ncbi:MAG: hypothetical protein JW747_04520 [Candidatus Aminicenantes bacterium]|nr:hypothetical protein [Candidatus Aminicenantes bacterium]
MSESKWPDWSHLPGPVKRVLSQAQTLADNFKHPRVTAAHIMCALTHISPHEVLRVVLASTVADVNLTIHHLLSDENLAGMDKVLQNARGLSPGGSIELGHLIKAAARACGFPMRPAGSKTTP